jgi:hypothetical protein
MGREKETDREEILHFEAQSRNSGGAGMRGRVIGCFFRDCRAVLHGGKQSKCNQTQQARSNC